MPIEEYNINDQAIFEVARKIDSRDARDAYLAQMSRADSAMEQRVRALLRAYEEDASFLESPAPELGATHDYAVGEQSGTVIGPYTLREQIGEGGFGVVFLAEQTAPVRRALLEDAAEFYEGFAQQKSGDKESADTESADTKSTGTAPPEAESTSDAASAPSAKGG